MHFVHRFLVGEERFDLRSVQWNGAVIVRCAKFEGFWVWRFGAVCHDVRFVFLRRLPRLLVLRPLWPPPPGCFQFPSLLWEGGWPRCLWLRVVSLTLEPKQKLPTSGCLLCRRFWEYVAHAVRGL